MANRPPLGEDLRCCQDCRRRGGTLNSSRPIGQGRNTSFNGGASSRAPGTLNITIDRQAGENSLPEPFHQVSSRAAPQQESAPNYTSPMGIIQREIFENRDSFGPRHGSHNNRSELPSQYLRPSVDETPRRMRRNDVDIQASNTSTPRYPTYVNSGFEVQVQNAGSNVTVRTGRDRTALGQASQQSQRPDAEIERVIEDVFRNIRTDVTMDELELQLELHECRKMKSNLTRAISAKNEKNEMELQRREIELEHRKDDFRREIDRVVQIFHEDQIEEQQGLLDVLRGFAQGRPARDNYSAFRPQLQSTPQRRAR